MAVSPPPTNLPVEALLDPLNSLPLIRYFRNLSDHFSIHQNLGLPPPGRADEEDKPLLIRDLFVEPSCSSRHLTPAAFDEQLKNEESPVSPLLPALGEHRRVVLLADPGMGKSTLIQWLITALIAPFRPVPAAPLGKAIPLPFILRDLVPLLPGDCHDWSWSVLLQAFKDYRPVRAAAEALAAPLVNDEVVFSTLLKSEDAFFLIDGLDEIGDPERRRAMRNTLWQGFNAHPHARFLVTSRIVGYDEAPVDVNEEISPDLFLQQIGGKEPVALINPDGGMVVTSSKDAEHYPSEWPRGRVTNANLNKRLATLLYLSPFDDSQQDLFARNWYLPRLGQAAGTERAENFMEAVRRHPSTQVIGRVPNLLYLLALLYRHKAHLPDGRAQVYAAISDAYLEGITLARKLKHLQGLSVPYTLQEKESFLATIAMHMQVRRGELAKEANREEEEEFHSSEVLATSAELLQWLAPSFGGAQTPEACAAVDEFIQFVARRAGLLLPRGEGVFAFAHLSFQEYYAARHLKAEFSRLSFGSDELDSLPVEAIQASYDKLIEWSRESAWREVFIFLVESQKEDVHITWALMQKVFLTDAAKEELQKPDQNGQPHRCLPFAAAELLASLSINRDVSLLDNHRQKIWSSLWQSYLRWPFNFTVQYHSWPIAPVLLQATPFQPQVVQALVGQANRITHLSLESCDQITNVGFLSRLQHLEELELYACTRVTSLESLQDLPLHSLSLGECTGLTSLEPLRNVPLELLLLWSCTGVTSLEPLRTLPLQSLNLANCPGVTSLEPLRALPLQSLDLSGCTGVTSLEPLRALPLQSLDLNGCTGVTDLEPLSALPLQSLDLYGCTGVTSLEPLRGLPLRSLKLVICTGVTSLEPLHDLPLQSLNLYGCTGVPDAEVEALKKALPNCRMHS